MQSDDSPLLFCLENGMSLTSDESPLTGDESSLSFWNNLEKSVNKRRLIACDVASRRLCSGSVLISALRRRVVALVVATRRFSSGHVLHLFSIMLGVLGYFLPAFTLI